MRRAHACKRNTFTHNEIHPPRRKRAPDNAVARQFGRAGDDVVAEQNPHNGYAQPTYGWRKAVLSATSTTTAAPPHYISNGKYFSNLTFFLLDRRIEIDRSNFC